jgi:hypothetical protein
VLLPAAEWAGCFAKTRPLVFVASEGLFVLLNTGGEVAKAFLEWRLFAVSCHEASHALPANLDRSPSRKQQAVACHESILWPCIGMEPLGIIEAFDHPEGSEDSRDKWLVSLVAWNELIEASDNAWHIAEIHLDPSRSRGGREREETQRTASVAISVGVLLCPTDGVVEAVDHEARAKVAQCEVDEGSDGGIGSDRVGEHAGEARRGGKFSTQKRLHACRHAVVLLRKFGEHPLPFSAGFELRS